MLLRFLIIPLIVALLTSCASEQLIQTEEEKEIVKQKATSSDKSPESLLLNYESKLEALGSESLFFYAPLTMHQASDNLHKAKALLKESSPDAKDKAKLKLITALRLIDKAANNKQAVKLHLKKADTHFSELQKLQAPKLLPDQFSSIKEGFSKLIKLIELEEIQDAIQQEPEFIEDMLKVEIDTLEKSFLGESINFIQQAIKNNAEDYAQHSLKKAQQLVHSTKAFIQKSYRDRQTIAVMANEALEASKMLYFISKEALSFHKSSNAEIERMIKNSYDVLANIEASLSIENTEIMAYAEQVQALLSNIQQKEKITKEKEKMARNQNKQECAKPIKKTLSAPIKPEPKVIMSQETNKAVLPELFMPNSYSDTDTPDEESLEFDAIEIMK